MFAYLANRLHALFVTTEERDRDAYLAESVDFADLERRIHYLEMNHQPYALYSSGVPHDWRG
jgi:hypothetical protein